MTDPQALQELLATEQRPWWRRPSTVLIAVALAVGVAAWWVWQRTTQAASVPQYVTQPVIRGNLSVTVTATGTLQPTRSVAVGSELSGTVTQVRVDVNDRVRKGQLLVELDRAKLGDAVAGSRAELAAASARLQQVEATLKESRAQLERLQALSRLSAGRLPSAADLDAARTTVDRAVADRAAAQAGVAQAKATLSTSETNLSKAAIRSPIDGIVLARNVEPGYAVAASLQAVTLFTLAEDLTKMKLSVNVDEADVAQVRDGQRARFTVAAQPGREYPAVVARVAFGSTTTDNVVTYTTQLDVDNADLSLRPGMTATATIATTERVGVLLVPGTALRFSPAAAASAAAASGATGSLMSRLVPRVPGIGGRRGGAGGGNAAGREATLWVLKDGQPVALRVTRGLSDGRFTEVSGTGLAEGLPVIVDQVHQPK